MSKDVYVVRHGDGWGVRMAGAGRVAKSFETKAPAFEYGRSMAKANQSELRVQNRNGQFGPCNSYSGHDPCPPRDKTVFDKQGEACLPWAAGGMCRGRRRGW